MGKAAHIVVLSEWDTPYGRALNTTFVAETTHRSVNEVIEQSARTSYNTVELLVRQTDEKNRSDGEQDRPRIHSYRYLRGIDGKLPGDPAKQDPHEATQKAQLGSDAVAIEATEGLNQSDYLRRLARR